jgi:DNA-directed RNA polymerase subunit M/transcription elongation factor TFIIS
MSCEECGMVMEFDDEIWAFVCSSCGDEVEAPEDFDPTIPPFDLSEDDEED